jgi:DUF1365 family protein
MTAAPSPQPALAGALDLYVGRTLHARFAPRPHRFSYAIFQILIDVDRLDEALAGRWMLRRGRIGLMSFAERDHGWRTDARLRPWVEAMLAQAGLAASARRIRLLCFPRILGFVFNPISVFYVEDADGGLEAVIYEVNNTFGQTHAYVAPARGRCEQRHGADKAFYVSPFFRVEGGYRFRLTPPGETLKLTIIKAVSGQPDFVACLKAERRAATNVALLGLFLGMPLMTLGVVAAIHWQALRLWLKGASFGPRPAGPRAGVSMGRATGETS